MQAMRNDVCPMFNKVVRLHSVNAGEIQGEERARLVHHINNDCRTCFELDLEIRDERPLRPPRAVTAVGSP